MSPRTLPHRRQAQDDLAQAGKQIAAQRTALSTSPGRLRLVAAMTRTLQGWGLDAADRVMTPFERAQERAEARR